MIVSTNPEGRSPIRFPLKYSCREMKTTINRRRFVVAAAATLFARGTPAQFQRFNIRDFGALGDGVTLDTASIQKAIDSASNGGGGTVDLPSGRYLSFTIHL